MAFNVHAKQFFVVVWLFLLFFSLCSRFFYPIFTQPLLTKLSWLVISQNPNNSDRALLQIVRIINTTHWECSEIGDRTQQLWREEAARRWCDEKKGTEKSFIAWKFECASVLDTQFIFFCFLKSSSSCWMRDVGGKIIIFTDFFWLFEQFELLIKPNNVIAVGNKLTISLKNCSGSCKISPRCCDMLAEDTRRNIKVK